MSSDFSKVKAVKDYKNTDMTKIKMDTLCAMEKHSKENGSAHILPINASSAFSYNSLEASIEVFTGQQEGFVYGRYGNPTITAVENKLAAMEALNLEDDLYCTLTSSGMSAIATLLISQLKAGDRIITQYNLYGGTTELLKSILSKQGIHISFCDLEDLDGLEKKLIAEKNVKLIYFESPSNPTLNCLDIKSLVDLAKKYGIDTVMDNTFCTPYLQRGIEMGIDFIIYSTTKFLNGHGNALTGAIICKNEAEQKSIWNHMKLLGSNCNPFDAWLLHNGIKTLPLRMDKHCSNAMALAEFLESRDEVLKVNYPGLNSNKYHKLATRQMDHFGAMLSFELKGGLEAAKKFMNACQLATITSTLGNVDTLLLHPATSSHLNIDPEIRKANGITDGLVRVSVGIENIGDIKADFKRALE